MNFPYILFRYLPFHHLPHDLTLINTYQLLLCLFLPLNLSPNHYRHHFHLAHSLQDDQIYHLSRLFPLLYPRYQMNHLSELDCLCIFGQEIKSLMCLFHVKRQFDKFKKTRFLTRISKIPQILAFKLVCLCFQ